MGSEDIMTITAEVLNQFTDFKKRFKKNYDSEEAEGKALLNIASKMTKIKYHNQNFLLGQTSFQMGIWENSDMSAQELTESMTGFIGRPRQKSVYEYEFPENVPSYLNYTQQGWVSRVMNQGYCGGCWAFSALGAWEGQIAKKTGQLVKLSEQNLIDCNVDSQDGNWGCRGGDMKTVYEFIMAKGRGINAASYYRYKGRGKYNCAYNPQKSFGTIQDYVEVETGNETLLMQALAHVGPLAIAVDASSESFQSYQDGVYDDKIACTDQVNHAVVLVGYGTDLNGNDYWLIKNSWGTSFGENGYMKIARNRENLCGVASEISYPII